MLLFKPTPVRITYKDIGTWVTFTTAPQTGQKIPESHREGQGIVTSVGKASINALLPNGFPGGNGRETSVKAKPLCNYNKARESLP
jgi:hypothetical protein